METMLRKWWLLLLQGILLIILSFYVFNHPGATLLTLAFWLSVVILISGIIGLINWLMIDKSERSNSDLGWSICTLLFGLLLLSKIGFAMSLITTLVGLWMLITGVWLLRHAIKMESGTYKWVMIFTGAVSLVAGVTVMFNIGAGAVAVSTIVGLQLLFAGIALIVLSIVKRKIRKTVINKITDLKAE